MRHTDLIPLATSNGSDSGNAFAAAFADSCRKSQIEEDEWIAQLRASGIKASHPDDGWVNRDSNTVQFCYCQFNDGVSNGDNIALGWSYKYRIVKVINITKTLLAGTRHHFK